MNYRRSRVPGGTFFLTVVTSGRRPFLVSELSRRCLRQALGDVGSRHAFELPAIVLMPDHFHMLMGLPPGDQDFSVRVSGIKKRFTELYLGAGGREAAISEGRERKGYRGLWQPRFWEHTIRDSRDYVLHFDYIHWNPVKHALAKQVKDWPWSTFHRYLRMGEYDENWCGHVTLPHAVEYIVGE
jgi:putative transposase